MPAIPLGKADNRRVGNAQIKLSNLVFEQDQTNTQDQVSFRARPSLSLWNSPSSVAVRGLFTADLGQVLMVLGVAGNSFFGYAAGGNPITGASGTINGTSRATFAAIGNSIDTKVAICGGFSVYSYTFPDSPSIISFPDEASVATVDSLASRIIATKLGSQQFYWTPPNTLTFDPLDFASAEMMTDNLLANVTIGDEEWFFGTRSAEVWVPTANPDLPFQRIVGRQFGVGLLSTAALAKTTINGSQVLFFIGAEQRKVFRIAPNTEEVSNPELEARLAKAAAADVNMFCAEVDAHTYLVVNMGDQGSMAMDVGSGLWLEWSSLGRNDFAGRYSTPLGDGRCLIGDVGGKLHILDPLKHTDNGTPIVRRWTGYLDAPPRTRVDTLILDCTTGQASTYLENPVVTMEFSDDLGRTWSDPEAASLGHRGEFGAQPVWTRLGAIQGRDGRLITMTCAEDLPLTVHTLTYNERP